MLVGPRRTEPLLRPFPQLFPPLAPHHHTHPSRSPRATCIDIGPGHEVCPLPRLYALIESLYESVKAAWENLFERQYGFWRGLAAPFASTT